MKTKAQHTIKIENLSIPVFLGVSQKERSTQQTVMLQMEINIFGQKSAQSDDLNDTLDYDQLVKKIIEHVQSRPWCLLEALSQSLGELILKNKQVTSARVNIHKPQALGKTAQVSVKYCCHI